MYKIILTTIIATIAYFLIGFLVFEGLLGNYMEENTTQIIGFKKTGEEMSLTLLIISCVAYAFLMTLILGKWLNIRNVKEAARKSALIGILIAIMTDSYWMSTSNFYNDFAPMLADIAAAGLTVGFMGGSVAWAWNYFSEK